MNDTTTPAPRRLKPRATKADLLRIVAPPEPKKRKAGTNAEVSAKVRKIVRAPIRPQTAGQADGVAVTTLLTRRHYEYLCRAGAKEGRTPELMLERFVRIQYAIDPTKGFAPAEAGSGVAVPASGR
jgi:hypothetical protein